jgi:hypothetical protein
MVSLIIGEMASNQWWDKSLFPSKIQKINYITKFEGHWHELTQTFILPYECDCLQEEDQVTMPSNHMY